MIDENRLESMAISQPMKGLYVRMPGTTEVYHPVDSVGKTLHTNNFVVYNLFTMETGSVPDVDQRVRGIFLTRNDLWLLSFNEDDDKVSLICRGEGEDYSFTIQADYETRQVTLRRQSDDEILEASHLEDFEENDRSKLRLLYRAFHSKYQDEQISSICLIPYRDRLSKALFGLCGSRCIWNFQCEISVDCSACRWFKGFKCM